MTDTNTALDVQKRNAVSVIVSGRTGNGKSAVYHEIVVALRAAGLEVRHEDESEFLYEAGMMNQQGFEKDKTDIEFFNPIVTMSEKNIRAAPQTVIELLRCLGYTVTPPDGEQPVFPTVFAVSPPAPEPEPQPDRVAKLEAALKQCMDQFAFYASEHRKAKKYEKALTNDRFRLLAETALKGGA